MPAPQCGGWILNLPQWICVLTVLYFGGHLFFWATERGFFTLTSLPDFMTNALYNLNLGPEWLLLIFGIVCILYLGRTHLDMAVPFPAFADLSEFGVLIEIPITILAVLLFFAKDLQHLRGPSEQDLGKPLRVFAIARDAMGWCPMISIALLGYALLRNQGMSAV
mmetsp:Transcript_22270/g.49280  ORF Transcript_22270/g.49280 Transcript_22270/m.49280 type:complete len:165 (+) Transcript_22270:1-495(+)